MLPSQPTTREESPLLSCSTSSPERPSCLEEPSQEMPSGPSWLISSCTENSMTKRRPSRTKLKKLPPKKSEKLKRLLPSSREKERTKKTRRKKAKVRPGPRKTPDSEQALSFDKWLHAICRCG